MTDHLPPQDPNFEETDFERFVRNVREAWERFGLYILIVIVVILGTVFVVNFVSSSRAIAHEEAWADLASITSPVAARDVASRHADPAVQALAKLLEADLLVQRVAIPEPPPETPATDIADEPDDPEAGEAEPPDAAQAPLTAEQRAERDARDLDRARTLYREIIGDASLHPLYRYNASMGLATVLESASEFDEAEAVWSELASDADAPATIRAMAEHRLSWMDRLRRPVKFGTGAAVADPVVSTPAMQPTPLRPAPGQLPGFELDRDEPTAPEPPQLDEPEAAPRGELDPGLDIDSDAGAGDGAEADEPAPAADRPGDPAVPQP